MNSLPVPIHSYKNVLGGPPLNSTSKKGNISQELMKKSLPLLLIFDVIEFQSSALSMKFNLDLI